MRHNGGTPASYALHRRFAEGRACAVALAVLAVAAAGPARGALVPSRELAELSLEQLSSIVVTSVSRRQERLAEAPASVFVITAEDIRRSGATSIPEALRLAPNLDVARADANQYAISARGFNNLLANRMLVLIDGRTVYTPLFSGVFWEAQDVMLQDVERIEVISGPGATLWGANAVNGVINVITRLARDTQGTLVTGGIGNSQGIAALRHGGSLGADAHYRVYAQYRDQAASQLATGSDVRDASRRYQGGFRADVAAGGADTFTVQGDAYHGTLDQTPAARTIDGASALARWTRHLESDAALAVQAYVDWTQRDHPQSFHERLTTLDLQAQYAFAPRGVHRLLAGAGYRAAIDQVTNSPAQAFLPAERTLRWSHLFLQDEIALAPRVTLTLGGKLETNVYTGVEWLPSARIAWRLARDRLAWGALSRAVRAPSRIDRDFYFPGVAPFAIAGNDTFRSAIADVGELGYRSQSDRLAYSLTAFHQRYDRLRSYEPAPANPVWGNLGEGHTTGVEGWATLRVAPNWRVTAGGVAMRKRLGLKAESRDPGSGLASLGNDPGGWWSVRSSLDLLPMYEVDVAVRHAGPRPNPAVPAYTAVDARIGWHARRDLEISVVAQNLFDAGHPEWGVAANRAEFGRSVFLRVAWQP